MYICVCVCVHNTCDMVTYTHTHTHTKNTQQTQLKREAAESKKNEQLRDMDAIHAENAAAAAKIRENHAIVRSTRQDIDALQHAHNSAVGGAMEQFVLLQQQVKHYHVQLETATAAVTAS